MKIFASIIELLNKFLGLVPKVPEEEVKERSKEKTDIKVIKLNKRELKKMLNFLRYKHSAKQKASGVPRKNRTDYVLPSESTIVSEYEKEKKGL